MGGGASKTNGPLTASTIRAGGGPAWGDVEASGSSAAEGASRVGGWFQSGQALPGEGNMITLDKGQPGAHGPGTGRVESRVSGRIFLSFATIRSAWRSSDETCLQPFNVGRVE